MNNLSASVLVRREVDESGSPWWVAQVLEYDLAAQGRTIDDLVYELQRTIVAHIVCCEEEGLVPFDCLPPAPAAYHDEFRKGRGLTVEIVRFAPTRPKAGAGDAISQVMPYQAPPKLEYRLNA